MTKDKIVLIGGVLLSLLIFALTLYFRSGAFR